MNTSLTNNYLNKLVQTKRIFKLDADIISIEIECEIHRFKSIQSMEIQ